MFSRNSIFFLLLLVFTCKSKDPEPVELFDIFDCSDCTYLVTTQKTDGVLLNIKPGDIVCFETGKSYDNIFFTNIVGTPTNPVIVRNCGGVVVIKSTKSYGVKFEYSENFKFLGDGGDRKYGIKISTPNGFFLTMEKFTTDFEISRVEVAGYARNGIGANAGFAGFGIKTSPYQECDLFTDPTRTAWVMRNIKIHDNYVHDTGGEGMYIGHGFYKGRKEDQCANVTYSHSIKGIELHDNLIERTGYDGIQIKNVDSDVKVYNNTIKNYGMRKENAHNEGLFIGEGTTGMYYNNIMIGGTGNGVQLQGLGNIDIFNNIVINSGEHGFVVSGGPYGDRLVDGYFNIFNNTVVNSGKSGFAVFQDEGGVKRVYNNIIAKAAEDLFRKGAVLDSANNIVTNNISSLKFVDWGRFNVKLKTGSIAIDKGADLSAFGVTFDFDGNNRPKGLAFDIGAFEY